MRINKSIQIPIALTVLLIHSGCADTSFSGGQSAPPAADSATVDKNGSPEEPNIDKTPAPNKNDSTNTTGKKNCDLTKDFVELNYPVDIQKCVDAGKLYNYYEKKCFDLVEKASSYECTKAGVKTAVSKLALGSVTLGIDAYPNAKLIGCGERRAGKTVLLQWWVPPATGFDKETCTFAGNMVIGTECYVSQESGSGGTPSTTDTAEGVNTCVKTN